MVSTKAGIVNDAGFLVYDYMTRRTLARLGYRFDTARLTDLEVEAFSLIEDELQRHANKAMKAK